MFRYVYRFEWLGDILDSDWFAEYFLSTVAWLFIITGLILVIKEYF